jgi:hypothetical protein
MKEKRNVYRVLVGKAEGKRPLGRPKPRWENNIKMNLGEIGWDRLDSSGSCEHGNEPCGSIKC